VLAVWGGAWLIGFGVLCPAWPGGLRPWLSRSAAAVFVAVLFAAAIVFSTGRGLWRQRGLTGPSHRTSVLYVYSWVAGLAGQRAVNLRLAHDGLPAHLRPLLWSGSSPLVIGLLLLAGGLLWDDRVQGGLGVWTLIIGAASVFAGVPGNFAVLAVAGGGGLLLASATCRRTRSQRDSLGR